MCGVCVCGSYKFVSWLIVLGKTGYCYIIICKMVYNEQATVDSKIVGTIFVSGLGLCVCGRFLLS
jgi:hypothetical protein